MIIFSFNGIKKLNLKVYTSWCIHLLTCSGLVAGFLSLINVFENNQAGAFLWLGVALIIDAIDGSLARKFEVANNVKNIDGKMLDSVIDFFNYIIIPSIMIYWFDVVPMYFEIVIPLIILVISSISYSKTFPGEPQVNMSLSATHSQNTNTQTINMTLPTLQASVSRIYPFAPKVGTKKGIIQNINFQYNLRGENRILTTDSLFSRRKCLKMQNLVFNILYQ